MTQKLTLRSIIIGGLLSAIMAMAAVYLALRMNVFYWASILTSLMSIALLKLVSKLTKSPTHIHEVNLTQSIASAGGILAAGISFTFPALFFLEPDLFQHLIGSPFLFSTIIFTVALSGGILGVMLSAYLRTPMIIEEKLPFPTGIAAADAIRTVTERARGMGYLFGAFSFAAIFTALRDGLNERIKGIIPLFTGATINGFNFQVGFIPMTIGGGYLIGFRTAMTWLIGCLLCNWFYQPILFHCFAIPQERLQMNYVLPLGVGIVMGSGLFILIKTTLPSMTRTLKAMFQLTHSASADELSPRLIPIVLIASVAILSGVFKIHIIASILAISGLWLMTVLASRMTGETNIDPMEILAVIIVVVINLVIRLPVFKNIILAGLIAVAVGVAADLLFDLKAGYILGTSPLLLTKAQIIGVFTASFVVGISLISLVQVYQLGSPDLFALQSQIVASMLGYINWSLLGAGFLIGIFVTLVGFSGLAFGVGFFIPMFFSIGFAIGGILKFFVDRKWAYRDDRMRLIAAGLIGGEGVSGSLLAIGKMAMSYLKHG